MTKKHDIPYLIGICLVSSLGGLLFGYDTAVISGAIDPLRTYFSLSSSMTGWAVSNVVIGCILGSVTAGKLSHNIGRKPILMLSAILFFISAIGSALATSFWFFTIFRIIGGIAVGQASVISPMYMSEVAPKDYRGRFVSMHQQSIVIGQTLVFFVNYFIAKGVTELWLVDFGWRYMLGSEIIPAILFFILLFFIPESPRWCVIKGKKQEAFNILSRISNKTHAQVLLNAIIDSVENVSNNKNIRLRQSGLLPIVLTGIIIASMQQIIGINAIMYYTPQILKPFTGATEAALLQTSFIGLVFIAGNTLGMYLIDFVGRVPLLKAGSITCFIGMVIVSYAIYTQSTDYTALSGLIIFVIGYAVSWGCCCWTLISEIFPNSIRSVAMAYAVGGQWLTGFAVAQLFPMINENTYLLSQFNGAFSFWVFGFFCLVAYAFVSRFVVETKGISLEKMDQFDKDYMTKVEFRKAKAPMIQTDTQTKNS